MTTYFYMDSVFAPAVERWLISEAASWNAVQLSGFHGEAAFYDHEVSFCDWLFLDISLPSFSKPECRETFGFSGRGEAAIFRQNEDGFFEFEWKTSGLKTGVDLVCWLKQHFS